MKRTEDPVISYKNIQQVYYNGIWYWKMCRPDYEKQEKRNKE